ncbi:hypothetical protein APTSU1_001023900 [Apodemus speciosus]|uniref:Protein LEG1 homolog n=1 Tax=Apodemus speciosus TaxID=105296 RepID=A0ABQ0F712_APOSI
MLQSLDTLLVQFGTMAVLASWVWALAACFSAAVAEIPDTSDPHPPLWEDSPEQLSDYRLEGGKHIINPWIFTDRMGMYRILLKETATYFARYGPENEQNLLWGLPVMLGWQYQTGRLADPTGMIDWNEPEDSLHVSVDSWWAEYMQLPSSDFDGLLKKLWDAHNQSLEYPICAFLDRYDYYSDKEANFVQNWAIAINYITVTHLPTTLKISHKFQNCLPPWILAGADIAPFIPGFTPLQNEVLVALKLLGYIDRISVIIIFDSMGKTHEYKTCKGTIPKSIRMLPGNISLKHNIFREL